MNLARGSLGLIFAAVLAAPALAQEPVQEQVTVGIVEVTLHASDRFGEPIVGLKASDLTLLVDGKPAPIETLEWTSSVSSDSSKEDDAAVHETESAVAPPSTGRRIVLLFQWEIQGAKSEGHVRMARQALEFIDTLKPDDQVAVMGFSSRLWLRQDFTSDRAKMRAAILGVLVPKNDESGGRPTLAAAARDGENATSIEKAFLAIGKALRPIPGSKAIVFFGWGIGTWTAMTREAGGVGRMNYSRDFDAALQALQQAQAPVFTLDTSAGHHQLEAGLERLSFETGGYYLPTYDFPSWAMKTAARALTGHYVLIFRPPGGRHGPHEITIKAPSGVRLLYRQQYDD
ncbi:MAG TPA: VWA domain-containing protein [Thermoanaerobaculia bacterium]